ncbi:C3a anaphylatoxin chemotactic receptor-like [Stegostoma tigrinum]|uniref:C3a anaphylatoxin chemotactic receptor-like n=1 Tax=Stegostoma tigrinum TaxID=3053191 RepID=UPI00202ACF05|nr:C3a anaphylatoxin chemotactic receptor-like [Stegostoma tigrinum]XP_059499120.1 C3a anaphylatoxin chemotactic receptor-like [Stegostoma tigrinum]XP_059499121.1 C3a anaphylatoxin chemotactic receptor-like [Stegostoma tigrinum]XP_059499122.1 C3a anaphylatoxin chemotactic receptor-like [Stegostoma tigrinum]
MDEYGLFNSSLEYYDLWFSNYTYENYTDADVFVNHAHSLTPAAILALVMYALTFILGAPGNTAVIWVAGFRMKRTVNTVWFLNLAAADLAYCLSLPFQIANVALGNRWPATTPLCRLLPSAILLNMAASVFLLTVISVDRCLAVTLPVWSQRWRTLGWAWAACAAAWALASLMCLPALLHRRVSPLTSTCTANYAGAGVIRLVEVSRALVAFALPFLVMAACYLMIGLRVRRASFGKSQWRPLRLILTVVLAFFVCWLPYHVFGLLQAFGDYQAIRAWDYVTVGLASLNSALNPLLYVFAGRDVRQRARRSLGTTLRRALSEEASSQTLRSTRLKSRSSMDNSF